MARVYIPLAPTPTPTVQSWEVSKLFKVSELVNAFNLKSAVEALEQWGGGWYAALLCAMLHR